MTGLDFCLTHWGWCKTEISFTSENGGKLCRVCKNTILSMVLTDSVKMNDVWQTKYTRPTNLPFFLMDPTDFYYEKNRF